MTERASDDKLAEMLAACEGVTPGPWRRQPKVPYVYRYAGPYPGDSYGGVEVAECGNWKDTELVPFNMERWMADAAHIANCDPQTIRSIITELQELRKAMKPFSEAAGGVFTRNVNASDVLFRKPATASHAESVVTAGHLFAARRALSGDKP